MEKFFSLFLFLGISVPSFAAQQEQTFMPFPMVNAVSEAKETQDTSRAYIASTQGGAIQQSPQLMVGALPMMPQQQTPQYFMMLPSSQWQAMGAQIMQLSPQPQLQPQPNVAQNELHSHSMQQMQKESHQPLKIPLMPPMIASQGPTQAPLPTPQVQQQNQAIQLLDYPLQNSNQPTTRPAEVMQAAGQTTPAQTPTPVQVVQPDMQPQVMQPVPAVQVPMQAPWQPIPVVSSMTGTKPPDDKLKGIVYTVDYAADSKIKNVSLKNVKLQIAVYYNGNPEGRINVITDDEQKFNFKMYEDNAGIALEVLSLGDLEKKQVYCYGIAGKGHAKISIKCAHLPRF